MLERIDLRNFGSRIDWLWEKVREQSYAFDDEAKGDSNAFLLTLFHPASAHWVNESGMVSLVNIQPKVNGDIHFMCWDALYSKREMFADAQQVFSEAFKEFSLKRITATIPHFNSTAAKMALKLGMKYEGAMRSCFLHEGQYYDLLIYGILEEEFNQQSVEEVSHGRSYQTIN